MAICIFVKGPRPTIATKIYETDTETLAEVIRLVEKLSAAHQLTATMTPSTVIRMSGNDRSFVCGSAGHFATTALMPIVMAVMNLVTLHRTAPSRILHQEHHDTKTDLIQGIDTPITEGTDHTPIMVPDIGDISAGHSPAAIPTVTEAAVLEGTLHTPLPATAALSATLQLMNAAITPHAMTPTGTVTPHPRLATSPTDITHATPQTGAGLTTATPTAQHKNLIPEKSNKTQDPQPLINPTVQRLSPSRIPLQFLHQIQTVTLIL